MGIMSPYKKETVLCVLNFNPRELWHFNKFLIMILWSTFFVCLFFEQLLLSYHVVREVVSGEIHGEKENHRLSYCDQLPS